MGLTFEAINERGIRDFGFRWAAANETAVTVAGRAGVDVQKDKLAIICGVYAAMRYCHDRLMRPLSEDATEAQVEQAMGLLEAAGPHFRAAGIKVADLTGDKRG